MKKIITIHGILLLCGLLSACGTTPELTDKASEEFSELYKVSHSGFREAWARPGAELASYTSIRIEPLQSADAEIKQPQSSLRISQDWELTPEIQEFMAEVWNDAVGRAATARGLDVSGENDRTLRIVSALTRIAPTANFAEEQNQPGTTRIYTEDSGEASIEIRLIDNTSGDLLAVVRDRRRAGHQIWGRANTITATADMKNLFRSWANQLVGHITGN